MRNGTRDDTQHSNTLLVLPIESSTRLIGGTLDANVVIQKIDKREGDGQEPIKCLK